MNRLSIVLAMFGLFVCASESIAQAQVNTIAGTGQIGYSGDGGPATSATLNNNVGVAYDGAGNVYISDNANFVIRKVNAQTGIITTVAGNGQQGFSGDGGFATSAQLGSPVGIHIDTSNHLYIADQSNHRVRFVSSETGVIITIAGNGVVGFSGDGGPATSARLNNPQGVTVDLLGNILIADNLNFRIRRIDASTGIITTICGNGFPLSTGDGGLATGAGLTSPRRIVVDQLNNIYILDSSSNARIRKIDFNTGIITRVAGGGTTVATSGVATDLNLGPLTDLTIDENGVLYLTASFRVWKVENGMAEVIAGDGMQGYGGDGGDPMLATFNNLSGITLDAAQRITLSDRSNQRIRQITVPLVNENYEGDTIAGTGVAGYSGDGGPAIAAQINQPQGLAYDGAGNLYIADSSNFVIRKVNAQTGAITTVAGTPGQHGYSGDGGFATLAKLGSPVGIYSDSIGNLYIADQSNHRVRFVGATSGNIATIAGNGIVGFSGDDGLATDAQLNNPQGVTVDLLGNVIIADTQNFRVRSIDAWTGIITTIAGTGSPNSSGDGGLAINAGLTSPRRIAVDQLNNFYILDRAPNARVRIIDYNTGIISTVAGGGNTIADSGPAISLNLGPLTDLAIDANGDLILTSNLRVWKVSGNGTATAIAGTGLQGYGGDSKTNDPLLATYNNLSGIALSPQDEVTLSDRSNQRIRTLKAAPPVEPCPSDLVTSATLLPPPDGVVDGADLAFLIGEWGRNPGSPADIVTSATLLPPPDGVVDGADLAVLIGAWGFCE